MNRFIIAYLLFISSLMAFELPQDLKIIESETDLKALAQSIQSDKKLYAKYDEIYQELQIIPFTEDLSEAEQAYIDKLFERMSEINEHFTFEEIPGGDTEAIFGITHDGHKFTENEIKADPNREYFDGHLDEDRNSLALKGVHTPDEFESFNNNIETIICHFENRAELELPQDVIHALVQNLELALVSSETSLEDKLAIYCLLSNFYEANELYDRLIDFLYLNMPDSDSFIGCGS
ncbi:MAG: hypothetical protein VYA54_06590 [Bdellovibrionota bacterium]|nr:hypothetical protein [Bdellovibrionota bacterium]